MNIIYLTNPNVNDLDVIPPFLESFGDRVVIRTRRVDLDFVQDNNIGFIVSDRPQFLIRRPVLEHLPRRIVNLHPSFLPWCRGYHPNFWSITKNLPHGVSLHFLDEGIDTGDIIAQTRCHYSENDTLRQTYDRLRNLMVELFKACWPEIRAGTMTARPQDLQAGCLHYRRDFDDQLEHLPKGWDTSVKEIRAQTFGSNSGGL